ncbi:MAG: DUF4416 family protein [Candidatus Omnitrophica bacterium]|nr:DUF4416 family protein [Candidatus Omnitrophota bacterium]
MGTTEYPHKVKLIVGLLSNNAEAVKRAEAMLIGVFGRTDLESAILDFTHSDYYTKEMGSGLKRKFLSFQKLFDLKDIYKAKLKTNILERKLLKSGKRSVNIDPGYLDLAKLVLFSTKDYTHRIYLNRGIFAEVTLFYKDKSFNAWPWTYPDYKSEAYIDIFNSIRELYSKGL